MNSNKIVSSRNAEYIVQKISKAAELYWHQPKALANKVKTIKPDLLEPINRSSETKHVAIYFDSPGLGGGQRVMKMLADLWLSMGLKVTILFDENKVDCSIHQDFPTHARILMLPNSMSQSGKTYFTRAKKIASIIDEGKIDAVIFAHWFVDSLPFDTLLCKMLGCKTFIYIQSLFSMFILDPFPRHAIEMPHSYIFADGIVCLSEVDRVVWKSFNPRTYATHNPISSDPNTDPAPLRGHNIIWPARLHYDKCPEKVIPIIAELAKRVPDCTLHMVGPVEPDYHAHFSNLIRLNNLENNILIHGEQKPTDMNGWYQRSDAFLLTSNREGWSLALAEALSNGLPCVLYDLPYLTLTQNNPGVSSIPQDDYLEAANVLESLLRNKELARSQGKAGQNFLKSIAQYDYKKFWNDLLNNEFPRDTEGADCDNATSQAFLEMLSARADLAEAMALNEKNHTSQVSQINHERNAAIEQRKQLESSLTYKIGKAVTFIPRKIKCAFARI